MPAPAGKFRKASEGFQKTSEAHCRFQKDSETCRLVSDASEILANLMFFLLLKLAMLGGNPALEETQPWRKPSLGGNPALEET